MPVRIRLSRPPGHTKLTTHFHIVAIDGRKRRDAKPLEILGIYDPNLKSRVNTSRPWKVEDALRPRAAPPPDRRVEWSVDRIKYWLGVGAQPSKTVVELLEKANVIPKRPQPQRAPTMADLPPKHLQTPQPPSSSPFHLHHRDPPPWLHHDIIIARMIILPLRLDIGYRIVNMYH
ncbi:hypothetical protein BS47DRAFT_910707 [Hydnum rufescens UP504]|uniref:Ribosomal protein S16 n=1 Tax=Hydnum rufescens UP504 TaxID=1448309 RepID=A0A9P6AXW9_9AGAM|nr:hypothetical protein BS47DRAFT_910707 [Hydnum rufescens UP504]